MFKIINLIVMVGLVGCISTRREKEMKSDIFALQTRLLQLEQGVAKEGSDRKSDDKNVTKVLASTNTEMDRVKMDIRKMMGDMDALRVGVMTGQMPGADATKGESVAAALSNLREKMDEIDANQQEILETLSKLESSGKKKRKRPTMKSISQLDKAFDQKRYKHVAEDAERVIRSVKKKDKERAYFLYAESLYKLGRLRDAALKYNDYLEKYPKGRELARAKMRMGDCFRHLGDPMTAKTYYEELLKEFPESDEAGKAKERMAEFEKAKNRKTGSFLFDLDAIAGTA